MSNSLIYSDISLFIGLTTLPIEEDCSTFYKDNIKLNFSDFKEEIGKYKKRINEGKFEKEFEKLYEPNAYYLFGEFDLAVISLIDDFSFATKKFRPSREKTFKYQVNTGLVPIMTGVNGENNFDILDHYSKISSEKNKPPILGISTIKLSSTFIVGNGKEFSNLMSFYIKDFLWYFKNKIKSEYAQVEYEYLIIESLGWNEITLVSFSNSFEVIENGVTQLRHTNWQDVKNRLSDRGLTFDDVEENSLLKKWICKSEVENGDCNFQNQINAAHPIIATNTQFGFHVDYVENDPDDKCTEILDKETSLKFPNKVEANYFQVTWNVKAGHDIEFLRNISKTFDKDQSTFRLSAGKNTLAYPSTPITFKDFFNKIHMPFVGKNIETNNIRKHIYKIETSYTASKDLTRYETVLSKDGRNSLLSDHYDIFDNLERLCFKWKDDIKPLEDRLRLLNVSKILKGQVINMFHNFNEAIKDQLIFNNFIDLRPSLIEFASKIDKRLGKDNVYVNKESIFSDEEPNVTLKGIPEPSNEDEFENEMTASIQGRTETLTNEIIDFVESWDIAFWNRYFHSYYFTEVSDFNLEHHGGIEMILSAYDSMYKIICEGIYKRVPYQFVKVTIDPMIRSGAYYNQLNFIHLFLPSLYASTVVHEAANHFLFEVIKENVIKDDLKKFILSWENKELDETSEYFKIYDDIISNYHYSSETEKETFKSYAGVNLLRYVVTDYLTYRLQFEDPNNPKLGIDKFFGFHLGVIAQQAELYRFDDSNRFWEFDEFNFKTYLFRLILMLRVFKIDFTLKSFAPFTIFQAHFNKFSHEILKNVENTLAPIEILFEEIRPILKNETGRMLSESKPEFNEVLQLNKNFIEKFYAKFQLTGDVLRNYKTNVLIRKTKYDMTGEKLSNIEQENSQNQIDYSNVLLDPKGGIFCISLQERRELHQLNCWYLKSIWDIAQKWRIGLYDI